MWKKIEDNWNRSYNWFLVDEGKIQYAFKSREEAIKYQKQSYVNYMLLTDIDNITNDTMLDPVEYHSWNDKTQTCLQLLE